MTQYLSGLKYALSSLVSLAVVRLRNRTLRVTDLPRSPVSKLGVKTSTGGFYSQNLSNTVIGRWRLCWPLIHHFSMVAWASWLTCLPSR